MDTLFLYVILIPRNYSLLSRNFQHHAGAL